MARRVAKNLRYALRLTNHEHITKPYCFDQVQQGRLRIGSSSSFTD